VNEERDAAIRAAYRAGANTSSIGRALGLSRQRVQQILGPDSRTVREDLRRARADDARADTERRRIERQSRAVAQARRRALAVVAEYHAYRTTHPPTSRNQTDASDRWWTGGRCDHPLAGTSADYDRHKRLLEPSCDASLALNTMEFCVREWRRTKGQLYRQDGLR